MQYVIVKLAANGMVAIVLGPFDQQGCSAAYKEIRAEDPEADLVVRGLFSFDVALAVAAR